MGWFADELKALAKHKSLKSRKTLFKRPPRSVGLAECRAP